MKSGKQFVELKERLQAQSRDLDRQIESVNTRVDVAQSLADALLQKQKGSTAQSVDDEMFNQRAVLGTTIDRLDAGKAKKLLAKIEDGFPLIKTFIERQYTSNVRDADTDGSKAKIVLKRAVVLTVRESEDAKIWLSAIAGL